MVKIKVSCRGRRHTRFEPVKVEEVEVLEVGIGAFEGFDEEAFKVATLCDGVLEFHGDVANDVIGDAVTGGAVAVGDDEEGRARSGEVDDVRKRVREEASILVHLVLGVILAVAADGSGECFGYGRLEVVIDRRVGEVLDAERASQHVRAHVGVRVGFGAVPRGESRGGLVPRRRGLSNSFDFLSLSLLDEALQLVLGDGHDDLLLDFVKEGCRDLAPAAPRRHRRLELWGAVHLELGASDEERVDDLASRVALGVVRRLRRRPRELIPGATLGNLAETDAHVDSPIALEQFLGELRLPRGDSKPGE